MYVTFLTVIYTKYVSIIHIISILISSNIPKVPPPLYNAITILYNTVLCNNVA